MRYLYVIGAKDGPVKIGISREPSSRLRVVQVYHPYELSILALCPITTGLYRPWDQETHVHKAFAREHLRGEWFKRSLRIRRFIELIRERHPLREALEKCRYDWEIKALDRVPNYLSCDRDLP